MSRTYYAQDACGNVSQFEQYVHIEDNDAPVLEGEDVYIDCAAYSPDSLYHSKSKTVH